MYSKKITSYLLLILAFLSQQNNTLAQYLISDSLINSVSQAELIEMVGIPIIQQGVHAYKIQYKTDNLNGEESIASGLIVVPDNSDCAWSLTTYLHGTISHKEDVPSRLSYEAQIGYYAASIIGSVVALPDYLGLGDSPGFHPYIHSETEASASIDMLRATREFCENHDIYLNDDLFLFGYSQGGHSTLALQKLIEEHHQEEFNITASIPMAGPYDVSGVQTDLLTDGDPYPSPFYLPYIVLSYYNIYPELGAYEFDSLFISPFDSILPLYFDGYHNAWEIDAIMPSNPVEVLNPDFYEAFLADSIHPFRLALQDNDLTNWAPTNPINFYYCSGDEHVTYLNAIVASDSMNNFGGTPIEQTEIGATFNHYECAEPSITQAIFEFLMQSEPCNTSITESFNPKFSISPNPGKNQISIRLNSNSSAHYHLKIIDCTGRILKSYSLTSNMDNILDISILKAGVYFLQFQSESSIIGIEKLMVNR